MTDEQKKDESKPGGDRQGQERRKPRLSVEVSPDPPARAKDNTFSTTVFVENHGQWDGGLPDKVEVQVNRQQPVELAFDKNRRASYPLMSLEAESHHRIVVKVGGRRQETLLVVPPLPTPEEKALKTERTELERAKVAHEVEVLAQTLKRVAKKLYVTFAGEDGKQRLFISVSGEDGNLVSDAPVIIIDGEEAKQKKTNGNGKLVYQFNFTERSRYVEVRAGNEHDLIWRARLNGPQQPRRQR